MHARHALRPAVLAAAVMAAAGTIQAAEPSQQELLQLLQRLSARVDRLEKHNAELEARLAGQSSQASAPTPRVEALETTGRGLDGEHISEREPQLATRLQVVEHELAAVKQQARSAEALQGIEVEAAVVGVVQAVDDGRQDESVVNWRGDLSVTLPGGEIGRASGSFFAQLRVGQAEGPSALPPTFTGSVNTASFQQGGVPADNANAIVAQAWYQLDTPLDAPGSESKHSLQLTVGKQDPFVFFDQNALADNEVEKFLNNVFVHNPMLDSGGAIGADAYGFTPGLRVAYTNEADGGAPWTLSAAAYGAREGSTFGRSFTKPLVIGQFEIGQRLFGGLEGSYRLYAWHNGRYDGYDGSADKNLGFGLSIDQRVTDALSLFGRYGHTISGKVAFDRALTLGGEYQGDAWGRGDDSLGFAWGWLRSAAGFRRDAASLDDFGYRASGAEQVAELYYRYGVNDKLSLTPDLQVVRRPGADAEADDIYALGVRALYAY